MNKTDTLELSGADLFLVGKGSMGKYGNADGKKECVKKITKEFFKQHGIANGETTSFKFVRESLVMINDLFLARDEGNMDEVYRILKGDGLEDSKFHFKDENFYFDIQAKLSLNDEGELGLVIECVSFFDFILYI